MKMFSMMGCLSLRNLVVELGNIENLLRVTYLILVDIWITFPHRKYRFNLAMLEILGVIGRLIMSCSLGHVRLLCDGRYGLELRQSRVNLPQECDNLMGALDLMQKRTISQKAEARHVQMANARSEV